MPKKMRKVLMWIVVLVLLAGLVYAGMELSGQSNKAAVDAGSNAADMEMASLDTIKKPKKAPSNVNWSEERRLRKKIDTIDVQYRGLQKQAENDVQSTGQVSPGTRDAGMASAYEFKAACDDYAVFWDEGKHYQTRARLARETGESRIKSAEMTFNDVDSGKVEAYNKQQGSLRSAQKEYFSDAKEDLSEEDRAEIKRKVTPRLQRTDANIGELIRQITYLISQVGRQVSTGLNTHSVGGCARQVINAPNTYGSLLSSLQTLLSLVEVMGSNNQEMMDDVNAL